MDVLANDQIALRPVGGPCPYRFTASGPGVPAWQVSQHTGKIKQRLNALIRNGPAINDQLHIPHRVNGKIGSLMVDIGHLGGVK